MFFIKDLPTQDILNSYDDIDPDINYKAVDKALCLLRNASLLLRELERYFARHNLSQTRFIILMLLDREREKEGLTAIELVAIMDISKTVVSKTLHALEKEGLVKSIENKKDARSKWLRLTEEGKEVLHSVLPGYYKVINDFMCEDNSFQNLS